MELYYRITLSGSLIGPFNSKQEVLLAHEKANGITYDTPTPYWKRKNVTSDVILLKELEELEPQELNF